MLVNEDYFDGLDIKEEDIERSLEQIDEEQQDFANGNEFIEHCQKLYSHTICFKMLNNSTMGLDALSTTISSLKNSLECLFDFYDIEHSEIFGADSIVFWGEPENIFKLRDDVMFITIRKSIDDYNFEKMYHVFLFAAVYVNFPKFTNKDAVRFITNLLNVVYRNRFDNINKIKITNRALPPKDFQYNAGLEMDSMLVLNRKSYNYKKLHPDTPLPYENQVIEYFNGPDAAFEIKEMMDKQFKLTNLLTGETI